MDVADKFFSDVKTSVGAGNSYLHANHTESDDTARLKRYFQRNSPQIIAASAKVIVAGLLSGGVAVGVAAAMTTTAMVTKFLYRRRQKIKKNKIISAHAGAITESSHELNILEDEGNDIEVINEKYKEILDEITYLIIHGELTAMMNAFAFLDADAKALEALEREPDYKTCHECWEMAEHVERISYRLNGLEESMDLMQDYVEYSVLLTSKYDENFDAKRKNIVKLIQASFPGGDVSYENTRALLNQAAIKFGVVNNKIFTSNHDAWVNEAIVMSNARFKQNESQTAIVGSVLLGTAVDYVVANAAGAAIKKFEVSVAEMLAEDSEGVFKGGMSAGVADGISTPFGVAIDLAIGLIDNHYQAKDYKTLKIKVKQKNESKTKLVHILDEYELEDIIVLRRAAKEIIEKLPSALKELGQAQALLDGIPKSASSFQLATVLLTRQKIRQTVAALSQALYMFHEITVGRAIGIKIAAQKIKEDEYPPIRYFILNSHITGECCEKGLCCYRSSAGMIARTQEIFGLSANPISSNWANVPFRPITNDGLFHKVWKPHMGH